MRSPSMRGDDEDGDMYATLSIDTWCVASPAAIIPEGHRSSF